MTFSAQRFMAAAAYEPRIHAAPTNKRSNFHQPERRPQFLFERLIYRTKLSELLLDENRKYALRHRFLQEPCTAICTILDLVQFTAQRCRGCSWVRAAKSTAPSSIRLLCTAICILDHLACGFLSFYCVLITYEIYRTTLPRLQPYAHTLRLR